MKYCTKCVMPDTRPGIHFDSNGVCSACIAHEKKNDIDWDARWTELEELCSKYRGSNGNGYDCLIAVSGGKDSHYQVYVMKELMGMNPLLVSVSDNFPMTDAGRHNLDNISEEFGCDLIILKPNLKAQKRIMKKTFEKYGKPTWFFDRLLYTYPLHMAEKFNIPLLVYGENVSYEYGGKGAVETYSARDQVNNGVASAIDYSELVDEVVSVKDLELCNPPDEESLNKLEPIYLSYFVKWNSYKNYLLAKSRGFKDLKGEWRRTHHIEDFDQVDSKGYLVHPWLKYPKFGHQFATDMASRFVRYGLITREEAVKLVKTHDHDLDNKTIDEFCEFLNYSRKEFFEIIDKFYNTDLFFKDENGAWKLKYDIK